MKVLMMTDIEGCAGVVSFEMDSYPTGKYYEAAKKLLTAEVNAAVHGLVEAGVEEVLVLDMHGPGGIAFEDLKAPAKVMHGRPLGPRAVRDEVMKEYDTAVIVGQHAMAGTSDGDLAHTQSSKAIDGIRLNGKNIGEIAQFALDVGAMGIPVILLTGDEAACREAEEFIPGITTVAVKRGIGRNSAISLSAEESRRRIRAGAKAAVLKHRRKPVKPLVWKGPFVLEKRFFHTDVADQCAGAPDIERVDSQTVRIKGDDIRKIVYR